MTDSEYLLRVKGARCVICWKRLGRTFGGVSEAHHLGTGADRLAYATVALCEEHHRGATGVHGMSRRAFESFWKVTDLQMLAWTVEQVCR